MGKQRKNCWKCAGKHYPPTGRNCLKTEVLNSTRMSSSADESRVPGSELEKDSNVIPSTSKASRPSSTPEGPDDPKTDIGAVTVSQPASGSRGGQV